MQYQISKTDSNNKKPNFFTILLTVIAAAIGVQNKKNQERDFNQNNPIPFIIAGLLFTIIFVVVLMTIVSFIIT